MMRFLSALAVLLGLATAAHGQATSIQKLPSLVTPADSDLFIVEHIAGLPGQKTNALSAGNLAAYIQGKLAGGTLVVSVAGRTGAVVLSSADLTDATAVSRSFIASATTTAARASIGAAALGANADITSLSGLTTPLSVAQGGTGGGSAAAARAGIGAAASGANSDITALSGLTTALPIGEGGTGATTAATARSALGAAASGANSDLTSISGLTTPLSPAQGGTGDSGGAWTTGSTTATASSGTLGTNTVSYRYKKIGRLVILQANVTITSAGSSPAGAVAFTPPVTCSASGLTYMGSGAETAATGKTLNVLVGSGNSVRVTFYDNSFPGANGNTLSVALIYESAT